MKQRYLTFDCYGTLIDWKTGIETALRSSMGELKLGGRELLAAYVETEKTEEITYKRYREVLRKTALSLSARFGAAISDESARKFASSVPAWPPFPDTSEFLRLMGERGYKRYILSNVDNDLLEATIRANRLEVDGFVTAEEVGSYKPSAGHWIEFMRRTSAGKDQITHVAQSVFHDIVPALDLGLDAAWVNRYSEPLPQGASPRLISDSLSSHAPMLAY